MKALIAMSGGVDSSVTAKLMLEAGYDCIGCTMRLWDGSDSRDAAALASSLGIPFYEFDLRDEFEKHVICKFAESYEAGQTPNPCIDCNRNMKFGALFERADELGCDVLATGHYARVERGADGKYQLKKALDSTKDQSYVLYMLGQRELSRLRLPLGDLTKSDVRGIAGKSGFSNANKAESQDICFVPDSDYASVLTARGVCSTPGDFVTAQGEVLGRHRGLIHYTVGQRKHLGISYAHPLYVLRLDAENNRVILGSEEELYSRTALIRDFSWTLGSVPAKELHCLAKIRYRKKETDAIAHCESDGMVRLTFAEPQRAVCPGQAAVLYDGDTVLGGGTIAG